MYAQRSDCQKLSRESFFLFIHTMTENHVSFNFKARYFKLGEISASTKQVWFVLHGYGQLAKFFVKKFNVLEDRGIVIIAPEGLSRFYLEELQTTGRKNNRVGATWMTSENRVMDIDNYIQYLNALYETEMKGNQISTTVLGFSQGSATASRWVVDGNINFTRLILWAGILPPDMNFETGSQVLQNKQIHLVYGTRDPFLTDSRFAEMKMLAQKLNTQVNVTTFDGKHEIDELTLLKFI
jgi:predicted esterase